MAHPHEYGDPHIDYYTAQSSTGDIPIIVYDHVYDYAQHSWVWVNTHTDTVDCNTAAQILQSIQQRGLDVNYDGYPNCPLRVSYNIYHKSNRVYLTYPAFHVHWGIIFNQHHFSFHRHGTLRSYHHDSHHIYHAPLHLRKHNHKAYSRHNHNQNRVWKKKKWHSNTGHRTLRTNNHRTTRHHYSGPTKKWIKKKKSNPPNKKYKKQPHNGHRKATSKKRRNHRRSR